ncbi:MAG: Thermonuclease precursor [Pseudomonadota bacterium]|jgi:endonuclease YncB( thermonuclease family)|nr:thermonuclease family protein [Betaproteobacteria bacterium]
MPWVKLTWSALLLLAGALNAATLQGKVIGVADGDTLTLLDAQKNQHKIRLQGIDAPEKAQAFGNKSKQSLHEMVHGKEVFVDVQKKDKYGRSVGKILVNQTDACLEQIKRGMAWHYKQYANEQSPEDRDVYAQAESTARAQSLGLWKDKSPTPPWAFRKQNK